MLKTFYGGMFMAREELSKVGINYPIKLEYYKTISKEESKGNNENYTFGVEVVKTEYIGEKVRIVKKDIKCITKDEKRANEILDILKQNTVTPIVVQDVVDDLLKAKEFEKETC